jgi:shikimate dehydrogenase
VKLAVFGSPVGHSLSPVMHRAALAAAGIDGEYVALDVDEAEFRAGVAAVRNGELRGANVTMPHKALAFSLCDVRSPLAQRTGAVNTLTRFDSDVVGENTDVVGIQTAWDECGLSRESPITILGAGSAAAAALVALDGREICVVARRKDRAQRVIDRVGVAAVASSWGETRRPSVVVNATSLGMRGEQLPQDLLESATGLFDMAYGNRSTPAIEFASDAELPFAAGLDMLVGQAIASFRIWTGVIPDPAVMRRAAEDELARRAA